MNNKKTELMEVRATRCKKLSFSPNIEDIAGKNAVMLLYDTSSKIAINGADTIVHKAAWDGILLTNTAAKKTTMMPGVK
jgi:hypothetical protein